MQFRIMIFSSDAKVTEPLGSGVLENSGNDLEEAAQGTLIMRGTTVEASLKLNVYNPAQADFQKELYDDQP